MGAKTILGELRSLALVHGRTITAAAVTGPAAAVRADRRRGRTRRRAGELANTETSRSELRAS
jgi:hypothetical protein